jgi:Type II CAAX prenyl endopeptidase Rce1-like
VVRRGESREPDLLALATALRPFRSLLIAVACVAVVFGVVRPPHGSGFTEFTYFLLTPYYIAIIALRPTAVFGHNKREIGEAFGFGLIAIVVLYLCDVAVRALALGSSHVAWRPVRLEIIAFSLAAGLVETVLFQIGIQARVKGWLGVVLATLIFFGIHLSLNPIFLIAGLVLCVLQVLTRRPGASLVTHAGYNLLISLVPPVQ